MTRERPGGTPPRTLERRGVGLGDALASLAQDLDRMSLDHTRYVMATKHTIVTRFRLYLER